MDNHYSIETKCIHSWLEPGKRGARQIPIYQSTTFKYDSADEMGKLFDLEANGYFIPACRTPPTTRWRPESPTWRGGVGAILTSSGQAATFFSIFNICEAGGHIICTSEIYGGTFNLAGVTLKKMGIDCTFVSADADDEELDAAFRPNTKLVFAESISNPALVVLDIERFAKAPTATVCP